MAALWCASSAVRGLLLSCSGHISRRERENRAKSERLSEPTGARDGKKAAEL